jgi:hypothetical protein
MRIAVVACLLLGLAAVAGAESILGQSPGAVPGVVDSPIGAAISRVAFVEARASAASGRARPASRHDSIWNGLLIGAAVGALAAFTTAREAPLDGKIAIILMTGGLGAWIDARHDRRHAPWYGRSAPFGPAGPEPVDAGSRGANPPRASENGASVNHRRSREASNRSYVRRSKPARCYRCKFETLKE